LRQACSDAIKQGIKPVVTEFDALFGQQSFAAALQAA
jgi:hypothetical protein